MSAYTEDILLQQTTIDCLEQQLDSVYTYNNENIGADCLMNGELPL